MEPTVHAHSTAETASVWTDEKHVNFLNTMEASFVRTMLHRRQDAAAPSNNRHHHHHLRLDRHLPDSAESTLDSKPRTFKPKKHAPSDSRARIASRRMRRTSSSQLRNSSLQDQEVPQLENGRGDASCVSAAHDDKDQTSYS